MRNWFAALLIGALLATVTTGCWNRRELDTLGIALGLGIDKIGSQYCVSAQIVNPSEVASARPAAPGHAPVVLYKATAPTVFEAVRKLTEESPRKLYAAHVRVLILGEALAREGVGKVLDLLARDAELRTDFFMLVAKRTTAEKVLRILTPLDNIPAYKIYDSLEASSKAWAPTTKFTLDQFINELVAEGSNPVLTGIEVTGSQEAGEAPSNVKTIAPSATLRTAGLAVFRKDRMVGWFDENESIGYNYIKDKVQSTVTHVSCPGGGYMVMETIRSHTEIKGLVTNGEPGIRIRHRSEVNIGEVECDYSITLPGNIRILERKLEERRTEAMEEAIEASRRFEADSFGFGQAIYRSHPKVWKRLSSQWPELFAHLNVDIRSDVMIRKVGTTFNSFIPKVRE